ncbi:MAG: hypothetical protein AB7O67_08475 [Vicinamibacterales bacterium]
MATVTVESECAQLAVPGHWAQAARCYEGLGRSADASDCWRAAADDIAPGAYQKRIDCCQRAHARALDAGDARRAAAALGRAAEICEDWHRTATATAEREAALDQALGFRSRQGDACAAGNEWDQASRAFALAGMHARLLSRHAVCLARARHAADAASRVAPPDDAGLLVTAWDLVGRALVSLDRDCAGAAEAWQKAAEHATRGGITYRAPRCATIGLDADPSVLEPPGRDPAFAAAAVRYAFKDGVLHRWTPEGAGPVDPRYLSTITARLSEPSGRVANCLVSFRARRTDGLVLSARVRTNRDGVAVATFCATGRAGVASIAVTDRTGARASVDVTISPGPAEGIALTELRWLYPNSLGLYGPRCEAVHWRRRGVRPIAHVFGGRGLHGRGRDPEGLELELVLAREPGVSAVESASEIKITGNARFTAHADSPRPLPAWEIDFESEPATLTPEPAPVRVRSHGCLPDTVGHYAVHATWRFQVRAAAGAAWRALPGAHVTLNDMFVTWRQPLPAVMARAAFVFGMTWPPVAQQYGTPLYEECGGLWYPRVYLECLRWSTRALVAHGALEPPVPAATAASLEAREDLAVLDILHDAACGAPPLSRLNRVDALMIPAAPSPHYQALDVIEHGNGNCGDWACLFHDLAAAQGVHVSLATLGVSRGAENCCMYPDTHERDAALPAVYDVFIGGMADGDGPAIGLRSTRDVAVFGTRGMRRAYSRYLAPILGVDPEAMGFVTLWDPPGERRCTRSGCGATFRDYVDPESGRRGSCCPACGGVLPAVD